MAALHSALQSLGPTPFSSVPQNQSEAINYLQNAFKEAQTIIDSVPLPPPTDPIVAVPITTRQRSSTSASTASNASEMSSSSARSDPIDPSNISLQKEWGKPIKLNPKENPLGMAVYKLGGKDGKGAWFARRSVHEGMNFSKWKLGLQREFPESLQVQGGPGEGNIRGIGGERRVERMAIDKVGALEGMSYQEGFGLRRLADIYEVYHLSAQFPGPTTPRDFVTLLVTSSNALSEPSTSRFASPNLKDEPPTTQFTETPNHFMVISRPCDHPECPPRDGFVRGRYESVEFIREVSIKPKRSASALDLTKLTQSSSSLEKEAVVRSAMHKAAASSESLPNGNHLSPSDAEEVVRAGRQRGKTISFAETRGSSAKGEKVDNPQADEDDIPNPVEWVMITRSDPGGSVPRFMVERGTPGGIVADASKFLDWACKKEHPEDEIEALEKGDVEHIKPTDRRTSLEAYETNGHLAGLEGVPERASEDIARPAEKDAGGETAIVQETQSGSLLASLSNVAYQSLESYAPQAVVDRLPGHQHAPSTSTTAAENPPTSPPNGPKPSLSTPSLSSSASSIASFASAEDHFTPTSPTNPPPNPTSPDANPSPHEKELAKLADRKRALDDKLAKIRDRETKDKESLSSKEEDRLRKAEEKHAKDVAKQMDRYKKEIAKLTARREREAAKEAERKRKAEERDEKARLAREKEEMRLLLEVTRRERDLLAARVGELQKENTGLVVRMGRIEGGREVLREMHLEVRERSPSVRTEEKG